MCVCVHFPLISASSAKHVSYSYLFCVTILIIIHTHTRLVCRLNVCRTQGTHTRNRIASVGLVGRNRNLCASVSSMRMRSLWHYILIGHRSACACTGWHFITGHWWSKAVGGLYSWPLQLCCDWITFTSNLNRDELHCCKGELHRCKGERESGFPAKFDLSNGWTLLRRAHKMGLNKRRPIKYEQVAIKWSSFSLILLVDNKSLINKEPQAVCERERKSFKSTVRRVKRIKYSFWSLDYRF